MTMYRRRLLCFALALSMLITLIPAATGSRISAYAENVRMGITLDKVNLRYGAGTDQKIAFELPANHVCEILGDKTAQKIHWFKVRTTDPSRKNSNTYTGYIHGDFMRELTAAEITQYNAGNSVSTPTPIPASNGGAPTPTPTPVPAGRSQDLPAIAGSIGSVTAGGTNFREGPGTGYHSIERLDRNTQVELLTIPSIRGVGSGTFYKVKYNGTVGYIMSDFISIISGGPASGSSEVVTATPAPASSAATPVPASSASSAANFTYTHVKLILSSCHLRVAPGGDYDDKNDWLGKGSVLPLAGVPVKQGGYTWYPVSKDGKTFYVRNDCVSPFTDTNAAPAAPTPTPAPAAATDTPVPAPATPAVYSNVQLKLTSCHLRVAPGGDYDDKNDWLGKGSILPLAGNPVNQGNYTWYPVSKDGKTYYVRNDCVQLTGSGDPAVPTATPEPTATINPNGIGWVQTIKGGVNFRATINGTVIKQIKKNVTLPYLLEPVQKNGYTWYFVQDGANRGYLRGDMVKVINAPVNTPTPTPAAGTETPTPTVAPAEEQPTGYLKTNSGGVNLRKKAGYTDTIGRVDKNVVLPYFGEPTKVKGVLWYRVKHPSLGYGYLHGTYVNMCNADGTAIATPTPAPGTTPAPINTNSQTEATYTTLKTGSTGDAVRNLVTELKNQGYFSGTVTNKYTTAVASAVKAFQKAKGLTADGIAGAATQHKLFNTVPVGAADTSNLSMTLYPAEKIDWYTGGINELWAKGSNYKVYDVKTGIVWWAHRWSGGNHADVEPLTAADTARLCKCYGVSTAQEIESKNLYQRRPLLVTIGSRTFACSLFGIPHGYPEGDTIPNNDMKGQVCIHFTNSKTHNSNKVDSGHEAAIQYAYEHAPNGHK